MATTVYFGTVDAAGTSNFTTIDDSTGWFWRCDTAASFTCPGKGAQTVVELSTIVGIFSGTPSVRLALFDSTGKLVCQGSAKVAVTDGYSWQGHMTGAQLTPASPQIIGGQTYRIGVARDAAGVLDTYSVPSALTLGDVDYDPAADLTGGWPATIPTGTDYDGYLSSVRVGIQPVPVGSTGTRRVGNARGPFDRLGFLKAFPWDTSTPAAGTPAPITGTGAMEISPSFAMSGSGIAGIIAAGALAIAALQYSGTSTQTESGTGSLPIASPVYSGTVVQSVSGSGALAIPPPVYSATVTQTETGTGSLAVAKPQYSASGIAGTIGSGSLAIPSPAYSGAVVQTETGTGSLAIASPAFNGTVVQTESGSGSLAIGSPAFSGTVVQTESGTGTLPVTVAMSGTGINGNTVTGTGSIAIAKPAYSGTVVQSESGSGSLAIASPAFLGTVSQTETGTGGIAATRPAMSGTGIVGNIGSGSLALPAPAYTGTGTNTSSTPAGKYKPEHDGALTDVASSTGFTAEHNSAVSDVAKAVTDGYSAEHNSALKDVGDAGA